VTIRKGEPWGVPAPLPAGGVVVSSDAEARAVVTEARSTGRPIPVLGLVGGDLCRTLGGLGDRERLHSAAAMTFPVDLGSVVVDGRRYWFVAHLVARNRLWRRAFVAMNAQWYRTWNLGPRSHPNDGLLDTYDARLPLGDLVKVRRRVEHGAHLPHPGIRQRRIASLEVTLDRALPLELDGVPMGRVRALALNVEPDSLRVVV
jgi:YegS C-terminal NAD kinase beta sandwich-like domain